MTLTASRPAASFDRTCALRTPSITRRASARSLSGRRVLLAEDEALLALELSLELEDAGAEVVVTGSLAESLDAAGQPFDGAILDVNLCGEEVFPAAEALMRKGVPLLFYTGHGRAAEIAPRFPEAVTLNKPVESRRLIETLAMLIDARSGGR